MELNQKPNNGLVWAVLCTAFCCLPLGVVAIIYSTKVDPAWNEGRKQDAIAAAKKAQMMSILGAVLGFVLIVIYLFLVVVAEFANAGY